MITVSIDTRQFTRNLSDLERNQLPYATSRALNATALQFQEAERRHMGQIFTVRRQVWVDRNVKITHFATKRELWATIGIHPPGGDTRADIIGKFEDQTIKLPKGKHVAVPVEAKRTKKDIIRKDQRPSQFNFRQVGTQILGDRGTFIIQKGGRSLIMQRTRRAGLRTLYVLVPRVRLIPDLRFEDTAKSTFYKRFHVNFNAAFAEALRTAR